MKRILTLLVMLFMIFPLLSGCVGAETENDRISVVCTNFAVYDWVNNITKGFENDYDITLLTTGGDIHSYQPTVQDIAKISESDLLIYVGGVSDLWTEEVNCKNFLKLAELMETELICGDGEHNHKHHDDDFDEHIWLSIKLAQKSVRGICEKLMEFVPEEDKSIYTQNRDEYLNQLEKLNLEYEKAVTESKDKTIVFADRFPFVYMMKDYGITYFAAFPGCSADSNATFEVVAHLAEAVDENNKNTVLVLENSKMTIAKTVIESTKNKNAKIAVMNSCQSIDEKELSDGKSYLVIMEENLDALKKALE